MLSFRQTCTSNSTPGQQVNRWRTSHIRCATLPSPLHLRKGTGRYGQQLSVLAQKETVSTAAIQAEGVASDVPDVPDGKLKQLLGMRGASRDSNIWKIRLQLAKPITWVPMMWGVLCGSAASGHFQWTPEGVAKVALCMLMAGPLITGHTEVVNDFYDRKIDAINEPYRPIPSGAISEAQVVAQAWALLLGGLGSAYALDCWAEHATPTVLILAAYASIISYFYSAPPLKLKQNGWMGSYALGSSYLALPWLAGQALFGDLAANAMVPVGLYSIAGMGIAIINDFKSMEGDRRMSLRSLPVAYGMATAKWISVASIDIAQVSVAAYLAFVLDQKAYATILLGLVLPQIYFQFKYFLPDPIKNDVKYQASAQPFLVIGLLTAGLAVGHVNSLS